MHPPRLDALARALATTPRRQVLKAAAASVAAVALDRIRPAVAAAAPDRCNGQTCTGHEKCCAIFDCSGAVCVATPGCVDVRNDPRHCGGCNRECDAECCKGECCFSSSGQGQVCRPEGCGCTDRRLTPCGAGCC